MFISDLLGAQKLAHAARTAAISADMAKITATAFWSHWFTAASLRWKTQQRKRTCPLAFTSMQPMQALQLPACLGSITSSTSRLQHPIEGNIPLKEHDFRPNPFLVGGPRNTPAGTVSSENSVFRL